MRGRGDRRAETGGRQAEIIKQSVSVLSVLIMLFLLLSADTSATSAPDTEESLELQEIEKKVNAYAPGKAYPDDPFMIVALQEAIAAIREGNGGVGACLVREATGDIVERGHNRQHEPYFRSDLHAEMDLLTRYEERARGRRGGAKGIPSAEQRKISGFVLYTSVEPCPMCLSRIINMGIGKIYWGAPDPDGGMGHKIQDLPPFWRAKASGQVFRPARCSPELSQFADRLFRHSGTRRQAK